MGVVIIGISSVDLPVSPLIISFYKETLDHAYDTGNSLGLCLAQRLQGRFMTTFQ